MEIILITEKALYAKHINLSIVLFGKKMWIMYIHWMEYYVAFKYFSIWNLENICDKWKQDTKLYVQYVYDFLKVVEREDWKEIRQYYN